ncbi:MAG: hypothetical protein COB15_09475 [Flavobacteriales bacterium]|nr:MAG: hypothetical protein COB15_09475 [Flavobacteriales bacterium]
MKKSEEKIYPPLGYKMTQALEERRDDANKSTAEFIETIREKGVVYAMNWESERAIEGALFIEVTNSMMRHFKYTEDYEEDVEKVIEGFKKTSLDFIRTITSRSDSTKEMFVAHNRLEMFVAHNRFIDLIEQVQAQNE